MLCSLTSDSYVTAFSIPVIGYAHHHNVCYVLERISQRSHGLKPLSEASERTSRTTNVEDRDHLSTSQEGDLAGAVGRWHQVKHRLKILSWVPHRI